MNCTVMQAAVQIGVSKNSGHKGVHRVPVGEAGVVADYCIYASERVEVICGAQQFTRSSVARVAVAQIDFTVAESTTVLR